MKRWLLSLATMAMLTAILLAACAGPAAPTGQTGEQAERLAREHMSRVVGAVAVERSRVEVRPSACGWMVVFRDAEARCGDGPFWPGACRTDAAVFRDLYACVQRDGQIWQMGGSRSPQALGAEDQCQCTAGGTATVAPTPTAAPALPSATLLPSTEPQRYATRELELASGSPQGMTLWEGKVIYSDISRAAQPGGKTTSRIVEHGLATGQETVLIEARPPRTGAYVLQRSGDWLIYYEGGTTESGSVLQNPGNVDYYALNLRSGQSQHLDVQPGGCRSAPSLSGSEFGDDGFAYITIDRSSGECRDQLRLYDLEMGEDRLLLETESADTFLDGPLLRGNTVIYSQAWREEWPPDVTPTPIPGRPDPVSPRERITGDVFSLDLETGERANLSHTGSASAPALWGDYLMWIDEPAGGAQEYGSGEVYILDMKTGQRQRLTDDASYVHCYSSPLAGDGFFVWSDARSAKDRLPVYFPETGEVVYLEGPDGGPTVSNGRPEGNTLFWSWSDWSGVFTPGPKRVYMTTFE